MLTFIAICLIVVAVLTVAFGGFVFFGSRKARQTFFFMFFCIAVGFWGLGIGLFYLADSTQTALWYVKLYYLAAALIAYTLLLFIVDYVEQPFSKFTMALSAIPVALAAYIIVIPSGIISSLTLHPWPVVTLNQTSYVIFMLYFMAYFLLVILIAWQQYRKRKQSIAQAGNLELAQGIQYVLIAIATSGVFGVIFNLVLPFFGNYYLIWLGPLGAILLVTLIFIAVVRHNLFDMRLAMSLLLGYAMLAGIAIVSFTGVIFIISSILSGNWSISARDYLVNLTVGVITIIGYFPLKKWVDKTAERVFFKGTYDSEDALKQFNKIVVTEVDLQELIQKTHAHLSRLLHPAYLSLVVVGLDGQEVAKVGSSPVSGNGLYSKSHTDTVHLVKDGQGQDTMLVQLRTASQTVGYMTLGHKKSGEVYRNKDTYFIQMLAAELSIAIQSSLRYKQIKSFNTTLAERIDEATGELKQSNKKLKIMDQTKDEFISLTSHQLRTPLTTVKGYLSMLMEGDAGELSTQQRKLVVEAFNSSQRMVHLISDFLNISRIQTGKFVIELSDVNLADILDEEIDQLRMSASSRQIAFSYDKPANFPNMPMDEGKIRQVMMNFIDNAIYYSPAGTTITIVLSHTASAVEFKVIDQGIGVPKDEQHKLFAKFSRASNARKQRPDGTGIGLFMAKKVIVALSGSIIFKSEEGKGSTFGFRLNR